MASGAVKKHWDRVASLGCIVTGRPNPTIHHCHGGSMRDAGVFKSGGMKTSDWLVIPLDADLHTGNYGIDTAMSVNDWERHFGRQVDFLKEVSARLGYDVFQRAREEANGD